MSSGVLVITVTTEWSFISTGSSSTSEVVVVVVVVVVAVVEADGLLVDSIIVVSITYSTTDNAFTIYRHIQKNAIFFARFILLDSEEFVDKKTEIADRSIYQLFSLSFSFSLTHSFVCLLSRAERAVVESILVEILLDEILKKRRKNKNNEK